MHMCEGGCVCKDLGPHQEEDIEQMFYRHARGTIAHFEYIAAYRDLTSAERDTVTQAHRTLEN